MQNKLLVVLSVVIGFTFAGLVYLTGANTVVQAQTIDIEPILDGSPAIEEYVYSSWQIPSVSDFAFTRFDAEYSMETGHIYVLGGRLSDGSTDGSIWEFNPVTGIYTDTGVDLPTPISNYQIARLIDGAGEEILMTFGGRPAAGGVVNTVQGYKPGSNTVTDFTSTDPYPVSTSPGGVAVVNNIAYIFGGFDAVGTIADTNIFDITAAAGSRFTAGPPLSQARSYIPAAVVDGFVYALGGDDFNGTALLPLTITEKLDPNNLGAGWDDAGVADMPIACEETPAFGFDTGSAYDLAGAIVVAGCGQWPDEIAEVMLYDTVADSWDVTFPDLNEARRNHAGAFVPTGNGLNGLPGMWIFGGIQGDDSNVLVIPEYYGITPLSDFTLLPREQTAFGTGLVTVTLGASNVSGADDIFDLSYSHSQAWPVTGPVTVGVTNGDLVAFDMTVDVPIDADCSQASLLTVSGVGQTNTTLTDTVQAVVGPNCPTGITGVVYDVNTTMPVPYANVVIENVANSNVGGESLADANGRYTVTTNIAGDYYVGYSAKGYQFSVLPAGWPAGADIVTINRFALTNYDKMLNAPIMETDAGAMSVALFPGQQFTQTFVVSNTGTSVLNFSIGTYGGNVNPPPPALDLNLPQPDNRIDPRIQAELSAAESGTTDFIVFMKDQADLRGAYTISDWNERGQYVYDELLATAEQSQLAVRQLLTTKQTSFRPFISANAVLVRDGDRALVNQLAAESGVAFLLANDVVMLDTPETTLWQRLVYKAQTALVPTALTWGIQAVNADVAWTTGALGSGVVVANIDTGVEWSHEALVNQYRGGTGDHDYNWYMPTSGCAGQTEPCDNDGHGTHTMGSIVGSTSPTDPLNATEGIGMAPGSEWIACKGCEGRGCSFEALLSCGDWMVAPTDLNGMNPDPTKRPHVVNNSWGGGGGDFWYGGVVSAWRASGIFPQFSAGNGGPACLTTGAPGDYWLSYAAAAVDSNLNVAGFSSRGPADVTRILKPNISAPGVAVRSSVPGNTYASSNGTSMSSPHVAGLVALLWSVEPDLIGEIENTMWLMSQTASPLFTSDGCGGDTPASHPNHTYGWGLINAGLAVTNTGGIAPTWFDAQPMGGMVSPSATMTVAVVFTAPSATGVYTGYLKITADEPYSPEMIFPVELNVEAPASAGFSSNSPIVLGETAVFTNTSTGAAPLTYQWDFGDGITSTLPSPTHTFAAAGTYTVTLAATNGGGTDTVQATFTVIGYEVYLPLIRRD